MEKNKKPAKMLIPVISIVTIAILLIIIIVKSKQPLSVQTVLKYTPENIYLAVSTLFLFFACFITRIVGVLPGDIVSLYFGACDTPYPTYLLAGISGSLLSIITTTILGDKISHPCSVGFFVVLLCRILVSVSSIFINHILNKRKGKA